MTAQAVQARTVVTALLALAVLLGCSGCAGGTAGTDVALGSGHARLHGTPLHNGVRLPAESFTDARGASFAPATDADRPVTLVFFGYSHCPDLCNVVLANVAAALRGATPAVRKEVGLVFVTTDPRRDTPSVIRKYLGRFDPSFVGLTASLPKIKQAMNDLHIAYDGTKRTAGGGYEVVHGTQLTGFVGTRARVEWDQLTTVADLRSDLTELAAVGRR
ncbi:MAG: hypothetical protein QOJ60_3325 [Actinomycetota bacterium]|nr:hypothetical protein [Actinomycetota bacterium]